MPKISRRQLAAAGLALPLASLGTADASAATTAKVPPTVDSVVSRASAWIAADAKGHVMTREWQRFESCLFAKAKRLGIDVVRACRSSMPEARAMRLLRRKITATDRKLVRSAEQISLMQASTIEGALAKIELGLKV